MKRMSAGLALSLGLIAEAQAGIRQRHFLSAPDEQGHYGQESIVHWRKGRDITVTYHDFSGVDAGKVGGVYNPGDFDGSCDDDLEGKTTKPIVGDISPAAFGTLLENSIDSWLDDWSGLGSILAPDLSISLNDNGDTCEYLPDPMDIGPSNILFTRKVNSSCGDPIAFCSGVVGLTGVRYYLSNGEIAEADIQFNDRDYLFLQTGNNNTSAGTFPKEININDVLTHELGHFLGIDHSASRGSTMLFSVADGQSTPELVDRTALYSLYPPSDADDEMGSVVGSVTRGSESVFGAFLTILDARTLNSVATEMSNLNGGFEACQVPSGPHLAFARSYEPAQQLSHFYYSGDLSQLSDPKDSDGDCYNPGCKILDQDTVASFHGEAADVGFEPHVFNVDAGAPVGFVNIAAKSAFTQPTDVGGTIPAAAELRVDAPLVEWIGSTLTVSDDADTNLEADIDFYAVEVPTTNNLSVRTAALSIYSRLAMVVEVLDAAGDPIPECVRINSAFAPTFTGDDADGVLPRGVAYVAASEPLDTGIDCTGLGEPVVYLRVQADQLPCASIPGTGGSACNGAALAAPLYAISAYDPADATAREDVMGGAGLSTASKASSKYTNLPSCSKYSTTVGGGPKTATEETACCGTLRSGGPGGPDAFLSFLLALMLSPLTWFASWWLLKRPRLRPFA